MGIIANWKSFVNMTRAKAESHGAVAQSWDRVHNVLNMAMILLAALTTISTLLPISHYIPAALGAVTTVLSAINGSLNPSQRRQEQMESSRGFRALMLKMVRVETERDYEELWKEYNKELLGEPFLPKKFQVKMDTEFSMTPEFQILVNQKMEEVEEALEDDDDDDIDHAGINKEDDHKDSRGIMAPESKIDIISDAEKCNNTNSDNDDERKQLLDMSNDIEMNVIE